MRRGRGVKQERAEYGKEIVSTLSRQLGWSHFVEMCRIERWSVRTLRALLQKKLHAAVIAARARLADAGE